MHTATKTNRSMTNPTTNSPKPGQPGLPVKPVLMRTNPVPAGNPATGVMMTPTQDGAA